MTPVVCDASLLVAFILPDERSPIADAVVLAAERGDVALLTAAHAALEVGEALNRARRRGRVSHEAWQAAIGILAALPLQALPLDLSMSEICSTAEREQLSCYDAAYLLLAQRLAGRLATADGALATAADRHGIQWQPPAVG